MTSRLSIALAASGSLLFLLASPALAAPHKYVGAKSCGLCHNKDLIGNQYGKWLASPHAKAFEALKTPKAIELAKKRGITTPPSQTDACVKCHATAHGVTAAMTAGPPLKDADGVQCESCHGPGSSYRNMMVMMDPKKAAAAGLRMPDAKTCTTCHNAESPTWDAAKGFDFAAMSTKIAHLIPPNVKGRYLEALKEQRKK